MLVKEIVKKYLEDNGFDGLCECDSDGCGCSLDDLMPCDRNFGHCEPAYKTKCTECGVGCEGQIGDDCFTKIKPEEPKNASR